MESPNVHVNLDIDLDERKVRDYRWLVGLVLVAIGAVLFTEQIFKTGWLPYTLLPGLAVLFLVWALFSKAFGLFIPGALIGGVGAGAFVAFAVANSFSGAQKAGLTVLGLALGWVVIALTSRVFIRYFAWWALMPAGPTLGVGAFLFFGPLGVAEGFAYILGGIALPFLIWSLCTRVFGLWIPGSILAGISAGIYVGWVFPSVWNGLARTGIMLLCFAAGWILIALVSPFLRVRFAWWAFIPAGVLALTGWGLFIGGAAKDAASLLANTGAVGLIVFGLYLLLWRRGMRR